MSTANSLYRNMIAMQVKYASNPTIANKNLLRKSTANYAVCHTAKIDISIRRITL